LKGENSGRQVRKMQSGKKIRVLIAKPGLDGHERGARVLAYGLRDEGFEVIYTGLRQSPDQIVNAAVQEDVDVIGLSVLSGAHLSLTSKVIERLQDRGMSDVKLLVGGFIPEGDKPKLMQMGVTGVFTSGVSIQEVAEFIRSRIA